MEHIKFFKNGLINPLLVSAAMLAISSQSYAIKLTEAYQLALDHNPAFLGAQATFNAEKERTPQARALLLPTIDATARYTLTKESSSIDNNSQTNNRISAKQADEENDELSLSPFSLEPTDESVFSDRTSTDGTLNLSQPILDRSSWLAYKKSFSEVELAELQLAENRTALLKDISIGYLNRLEAGELIDINLAELEAVENHFSLTDQRHISGLGNKSDVFESESRVFIAKSDILDTQTRVAQAEHKINRLLDQPVDQYNTLPESYRPELITPEDPTLWISAAELVTHDLQVAIKQTQIAEFSQKQSSAGHWPTLDLQGSYTRNDLDNDSTLSSSSTDSSLIGLNLKIPLFSGLATRSKVIESKHRLLATQHARHDIQSSLGERVRNAYQDAIASHAKMNILESAYHLSESALSLRREGFLEGLSTNLDLLDSYREVFSAKRRWRISVYDYLRATISLKTFLVEDLNDYISTLDAVLVTENQNAQ